MEETAVPVTAQAQPSTCITHTPRPKPQTLLPRASCLKASWTASWGVFLSVHRSALLAVAVEQECNFPNYHPDSMYVLQSHYKIVVTSVANTKARSSAGGYLAPALPCTQLRPQLHSLACDSNTCLPLLDHRTPLHSFLAPRPGARSLGALNCMTSLPATSQAREAWHDVFHL
jgi:hypothetical protein